MHYLADQAWHYIAGWLVCLAKMLITPGTYGQWMTPYGNIPQTRVRTGLEPRNWRFAAQCSSHCSIGVTDFIKWLLMI